MESFSRFSSDDWISFKSHSSAPRVYLAHRGGSEKRREKSCCFIYYTFYFAGELRGETDKWGGEQSTRIRSCWPLAIFCKQPKAAGGGGQLAGWQKVL